MYNTEAPKILEPLAEPLRSNNFIEIAEEKPCSYTKKDPLDINFENTMVFEN